MAVKYNGENKRPSLNREQTASVGRGKKPDAGTKCGISENGYSGRGGNRITGKRYDYEHRRNNEGKAAPNETEKPKRYERVTNTEKSADGITGAKRPAKTGGSADIVVVGGGASGLAAAIAAARCGASVIILESGARVGKKLITTGNGRCNITNMGELSGRYHGDEGFAKRVFSRVGRDECIEFFESIGIPVCTLEDERAYPMSLQAGSVVDALRFAAQREGAEISAGQQVVSVKKDNHGGFNVCCESGDIYNCKRVIICTGGMAAPKTGSNGSGYALLEKFGHTKTPVFPAIVQLTTEISPIKALKGIKLDCTVSAVTNKGLRAEFGELLFTEYGISGPPVLQLGRFASDLKDGAVHIDLLPEITGKEFEDMLLLRRNSIGELPITSVFMGILHSRLGETVARGVLSDPARRFIKELGADEITSLVKRVKDFSLKVTGTLSWNNAQVTAGGIDTSEFDGDTMQSRIVSGVYAAGEILNVDGDCGGFNLQWAWSSGLLAGKSAAGNPASDKTARTNRQL